MDIEKFKNSDIVMSASGIVSLKGTDKSFCCICSLFLQSPNSHNLIARHKILFKRFNKAFIIEGNNIYCKATCRYVDWHSIKSHAVWHKITPWFGKKLHNKIFFENHMNSVRMGYYCFLCHKLFDFWDSAEQHMGEFDHRNLKEEAGPVAIFENRPYTLLVSQGFVPGKDGQSIDCKMCLEIGLGIDEALSHYKTREHKVNRVIFVATMLQSVEPQQIDKIESCCDSPKAEDFESKTPEFDIPDTHDFKNIELQSSFDVVGDSSDRQSPDMAKLDKNLSMEQLMVDRLKKRQELRPVKKFASCLSRTEKQELQQQSDLPTNSIESCKSEFFNAAITRFDERRRKNVVKQEKDKLDPCCLANFPELGDFSITEKRRRDKPNHVGRKKARLNSHVADSTRGDHNGMQNVVEQMKNSMEMEEEATKLNSSGSRDSPTCLYIVKRNAKKSFCQICDERQNSIATRNISKHINSERHRIALKRYGCENVCREENGVYYCQSCDCKLDNPERVYLHIKDKKHLSSLIKACSNNVNQRSKRKAVSPTFGAEFSEPSENLLSSHIAKKMNPSFSSNFNDFSGRGMISNFTLEPNITEKTTISQKSECNEPQWPEKITRRNSDDFSSDIMTDRIKCSNDHAHVSSKYSNNSPDTGDQLDAILSDYMMLNDMEIDQQPELTTFTSSMVSEISRLLASCDAEILTSKVEKRKIERVREHRTLNDQLHICNFCGETAVSITKLHVHMTSHYTEEFVRLKTRRDVPTVTEVNNDVINASDDLSESIDELTHPEASKNNDEDGNSDASVENSLKIPKREIKSLASMANVKDIVKLLKFHDDYIYDLDDKMSEIEMGLKLALPIDSTKIYCLICREIVEHTLENYLEHLSNVDHCTYMDEMETDAALYDNDNGQSSDLDLAHEYMQEMSDDEVRCVICDVEVRNNEKSLQGHINHEVHERKCEQTRAIATKYFEGLRPRMRCDWYGVEKYWCVVCMKNTASEVEFVEHLNSKIHKSCTKNPHSVGKRTFIDYCAPCALMWYGYRCTFSYHKENNTHKWFERDRYYVNDELTDKAKNLLSSPDKFVNDRIDYLDNTREAERAREEQLRSDLLLVVRSKYPKAKAYIFGSRATGLSSPNTDLDVFLDCQNVYNGGRKSLINCFIQVVNGCLNKYPESWDVDEMLTSCRTPIIRARHRATGLYCDISFASGLAVENTKLIKIYIKIFPTCRKLTVFLKQWLVECNLSDAGSITTYALFWYVIFYLQKDSILPSVMSLLGLSKKSRLVSGWEVGSSKVPEFNKETNDVSVKEFLVRFFTFYADFDFRHDVASPLIADSVKKESFAYPKRLPKGMECYIRYIRAPGQPDPFRFDSPMCIQDPFDLQHNLTKAVSKAYVNRFRKYCLRSLDVLCSS